MSDFSMFPRLEEEDIKDEDDYPDWGGGNDTIYQHQEEQKNKHYIAQEEPFLAPVKREQEAAALAPNDNNEEEEEKKVDNELDAVMSHTNADTDNSRRVDASHVKRQRSPSPADIQNRADYQEEPLSPTEPFPPVAPAPQQQRRDDPSGVDGIGMWKSWTNNYEHSRFACLDLLDNCFDATLHPNFQGKVSMQYLPTNGIVIINNSAKAIKSLEETLTAYRSIKDSADKIGEYGVGLKQACATLSKTSFVLTRNHDRFDIGVIAHCLQTKTRICLPHFNFTVQSREEDKVVQEIRQNVVAIMKDNPKIMKIATSDLGFGNRNNAIDALVKRCNLMWSGEWEEHDHVFQLVVTDLIHTQDESIRARGGVMKQPAVNFLEEIRELLPRYYINIPADNFEFYIRKKKVLFVYWQHRLVEMTKFEINVCKTQPIREMADESNWVHKGHNLTVFCGFDALRLADKNKPSTCSLCIYSRNSGRLIEITDDARQLLGIRSSGSAFSQGLTIIVDDTEGHLPLKPTKDGLSFSKYKNGDVHQSNLYAWLGAVGYMYWQRHADVYIKAGMTDYITHIKTLVLSFVKRIERRMISNPEGTPGKLTEFSDVRWNKAISPNSLKMTIRTNQRDIAIWPGEATLWRLPESAPQVKTEASASGRRGSSLVKYKDASDSSSGSEAEQVISRAKKVATRKPAKKKARVGRARKALNPAELFFGSSGGRNGSRQSSLQGSVPNETENLRQSLQTASQENEVLKQQNLQLQRNLQQSEDRRKREVTSLQSDVERLQLELQQCNNSIHQLQQGGNVFSSGEDWL